MIQQAKNRKTPQACSKWYAAPVIRRIVDKEAHWQCWEVIPPSPKTTVAELLNKVRPPCKFSPKEESPHVLRIVGIIIHLLRAPLHVVHVEFLLVRIHHTLEAHIICLIGVKSLTHDNVSAAT